MAQYLNTSQRITVIKTLVFFSLVRWYNLVLIAVAQYLTAIKILRPSKISPLEVLATPQLHWIVFSTALIIAGGYIINAFYDYEKDLANHGEEVILNKIISKRFAINAYMFCNSVALAIGLFLNFKLLLFYCLLIFLLWFYSHKLKKLPLLGNFCASFLAVSAFLSICIFYWGINRLIVYYAVYIGLIALIREIIKDIEGIKGDILFGYKTFPVKYGIKKTKMLVAPLMLVCIPVGYYLFMYFTPRYASIYFSVSFTGIFLTLIYFIFTRDEKNFRKVDNYYKILIVLGVLNIALV
ncbi:MAG TPA: geranylgeranylglycerol-phosphate geranylgeranyltransferase [Bacteroidia bacterium]|nr:geranylgeranylglycerol-phosphate geranylgeranyltransferase [Bacteroidia bacterium]